MSEDIVRQEEFGKDLGLIHEAVITGRKVGMTKELWKGLAHNEGLFRRVVTYIQRGGYEATTNQRIARQIMGQNFLGPEEVAEHFGILLTQKELNQVGKVPFSEKILEECKDEFILVLGVDHDSQGKPLTIARLNQMFPPAEVVSSFYPSSFGWMPPEDKRKTVKEEILKNQPCIWPHSERLDERYAEEYVKKETPELCWYLVRKSVTHLNTDWGSYQHKEAYLEKDEYLPQAVVYIYTLFLMYKSRDERPLLEHRTWTGSVDSYRRPAIVGIFELTGLRVSTYSENLDESDLHCFMGFAPAKKPEI